MVAEVHPFNTHTHLIDDDVQLPLPGPRDRGRQGLGGVEPSGGVVGRRDEDHADIDTRRPRFSTSNWR